MVKTKKLLAVLIGIAAVVTLNQLIWYTVVSFQIKSIFEQYAVRFARIRVDNLNSVSKQSKTNSTVLNRGATIHGNKSITSAQTKALTLFEKVYKITQCYNRSLEPTIKQHGDYWVLHNYIQAEKQFGCSESVTFTTQGDYSFLDNLISIMDRWKGPISVALHAPGTDFQPTLDSIAYLRNCKSPLFKKFVTFHLVFDSSHLPTLPSSKPYDAPLMQLYNDTYNCKKKAPYANVTYKNMYKTKVNISYPINVVRNVARDSAQTHFVLASDIELYPSSNLISQFLRMVVNRQDLFKTDDLKIFVLPVFEVLANETAPVNKTVLKKMFETKRAFSFHKNICNRCHAIPKLEQWLNLTVSDHLDIFTTIKRQGTQVRWEAVYIGTNNDPWFDERFDWERHGNKMTQAYLLCLLDYDYMVLDNAFLVHRSGIKKKMVNAEVIPKTAKYISKHIGIELDILYGKRKGCKA